MTAQKCHIIRALPTSYRGLLCLRRNAITSPPSTGAAIHAQQCRVQPAPASFIWCRLRIAAMPIEQRTKGRVRDCSQKCHTTYTLPNQFNGVIVKTQKCRDIVAPRERSYSVRSNAALGSPLPTSLAGAITTSQKCYKLNAPRGKASAQTQQCRNKSASPTSYRGPFAKRRNAKWTPPPPNLGYSRRAEMPRTTRPITRGHPSYAEMPPPLRLAT